MSHNAGPSERFPIWARLWTGFKRSIKAFLGWVLNFLPHRMRRSAPDQVNESARLEARQPEPYPTALLEFVNAETIRALPEVLIGRQLQVVPDNMKRLEQEGVYYYRTPNLREFGERQVIRGMDLDERPFISYKSLDDRGEVLIRTLFPLELNPIGEWRVVEKNLADRYEMYETFFSKDLERVTRGIGQHLHSILSYTSASIVPPPYVANPPQNVEDNAPIGNPASPEVLVSPSQIVQSRPEPVVHQPQGVGVHAAVSPEVPVPASQVPPPSRYQVPNQDVMQQVRNLYSRGHFFPRFSEQEIAALPEITAVVRVGDAALFRPLTQADLQGHRIVRGTDPQGMPFISFRHDGAPLMGFQHESIRPTGPAIYTIFAYDRVDADPFINGRSINGRSWMICARDASDMHDDLRRDYDHVRYMTFGNLDELRSVMNRSPILEVQADLVPPEVWVPVAPDPRFLPPALPDFDAPPPAYESPNDAPSPPHEEPINPDDSEAIGRRSSPSNRSSSPR